jgi:PilZ domain
VSTENTEQRSKRRYAIEREVKYRLLSGHQIAETGSGKTLNISSSGVSFTTEQSLQVGSILELSVSWPALLNNSCAMKLMVFGRIVRSASGIAAMTIERYEFRTQATRPLQPTPTVGAEMRPA